MATNFKHKDISQIFDMVRDRDHYTVIRDFFELSAISIRNNFDHGNEYANLEKMYKEIAQEAAPEQPKEETREPVPVIAETEPTMDSNGQYSLF